MPRSWHRRIPRVIASRARSRTPGSALPGPILRCTDRHSPPMAVPTVSTARLTMPRRARSQSRRASRRGLSSTDMSTKENPASGTWARKASQSARVASSLPRRAFS